MTLVESDREAVARPPAGRAAPATRASPPARRRRRTARSGVVVTGAAAVIALALSGAVAHLGVARDTDAAVAELRRVEVAIDAATSARLATEAELLATGRSLVAARAALDDGVDGLRGAIGAVAAATAARDEAAASLAVIEGRLAETTGSVTAADSAGVALRVRIGALRACLSGVNRALVLTAFDDHGGALRALAEVTASCDAAREPS